MAKKKSDHVQVEIFDQAYTVRAGKQAGYIESLARYVDEQMRAVSRDNTTVDSLKIAVFTSATVAKGSADQISAAVPAMCGVAILVPLAVP